MILLNQIWQQRRVSKLMLIKKWVLTILAIIKEKQSSMVYEDRNEMKYRRNTPEKGQVNFIHTCYISQVQ